MIREQYPFDYVKLAVGEAMQADQIPFEMRSLVVNFVQGEGLQPRHVVRRVEEEVELPYDRVSATLMGALGRQVRKSVCYDLRQHRSLPDSCLIVDLPADGEFIPTLRILLYLLPLQMAVCFLVSAFRIGWPPGNSELRLIKHYYQYMRPDSLEEGKEVRGFGEFVARELATELRRLVEARVGSIESELRKVSQKSGE